MARAPMLTDTDVRVARRRKAAGESVRSIARSFAIDHRGLDRRMKAQEKADKDASAESQHRARQRSADRALASKHGQPWVEDGLTADDVAEARAASGVDPVPDPAFVPRELPEAHRRQRTTRPAGRKEAAAPLVQIRRLPDGTMFPVGAPELPDGVMLGTVLDADAFGRGITRERFKWLLSCAAAEERLLEDPRYPGQGRYSQTVNGRMRCFIWLGNPADLDTFSRYASANYVPPAGLSTGRIIVLDDREPNEETEADWQIRTRADAQEWADRDTSRWAVCDPSGHALVSKPSRAAADDALTRWQAKSDVELHLEEVPARR